MNRILAAIVLLLFSFRMQSQGIEFFHGTWKEALEKAKTEDKLLFVDAFAKWCGPCKAMAKNVFTQQNVGDYFNANFINLKLDMEEVDGVTFGHKYPVQAYPTLFFIDGDGNVIKNIKGGQQPESLINLGIDAIKKLDKSGRYASKYESGDRSYELVYNYIKALNAADKPSLKISNDYLSSNPAISENEKLLFILEAASEADSKLFDHVIENKTKLMQLAGIDMYEEKCKSACQKLVDKSVQFEMESLLTEANSKALKTFPKSADEFIAKANMKFYKAFRNDEKYAAAYKSLAKEVSKNPEKLKFIIQDITKHYRDQPKMVDDAAQYAEKIYNHKQDIESLNQLCSLLVLSNQVDKAIKTVSKMKEKTEKEGGDLTQFDGLLNFLNSKKA